MRAFLSAIALGLSVTATATEAQATIKTAYAYKGQFAGNVEVQYDQVKDLATCAREKVTVKSPVGPMSEEVSMIFRGPMDIHNIAVYQPSASGGGGGSGEANDWSRVSSYSREPNAAENLVFMNNMNAVYGGPLTHGPQGYATADGLKMAETETPFGGKLAEATGAGTGMGLSSGAEVNIMTSKKCAKDCFGFHGPNDHHGWGGGKKIFVTKVQMPWGAKPNQPAIWMLNAQVMHSGQYQCNCRGIGGPGGCGELDIAEVIETKAERDRVSTHYYFGDGKLNAPLGDNWAPRPTNGTTVYVVVIDDSGEGLIKLVETSDFDFSQKTIPPELLKQWIAAPTVN